MTNAANNRQYLDHRIDKKSIDYKTLTDIFYFDTLRASSRGDEHEVIEGHYIRTAVIMDWDTLEGHNQKEILEEKVNRFNLRSIDHEMYISSYNDYDEDPGERTYLAYYTIGFKPKTNEK